MRWSKEELQEYMQNREYWNAKPLLEPRDLMFSGEQIADQEPESKLQASIQKWAVSKGFPYFHDRSRKKNTPGWPDLTIIMPKGIVLFLELKSAKGVMRPDQQHIRQQMVFLGHHHYIVKSYKSFLKIILEFQYES